MAQNNIDDLHGDRKYRKQGLHNGNLVETLFWNFGEVAWWGKQPSGVWPRGTNHSYMDGIFPIVAAEVNLINGDTIHIVEGGYREHFESGPTGIEYGWQPLPGFSNPDQDYIAMSDAPTTWPDYWPDKPANWGGKWNGYFGQRTNADQESYFVIDDYQDHGRDFYGLFNCDKNDSTRGGLGMRIAVRGFQWSNVLAEDIIFWHYDITNISTTHYSKAVFGMYCDAGVGGQNDSNDDNSYYDLVLDLAYTWDSNGIGEGGWGPTGYAGYAFLESPGNPFDGIDNDGDAIDGSGPTLQDINFQPKPLPDKIVLIDYTNMFPENDWGRIVVSFSQGGSGSFWSFIEDTLNLTIHNNSYIYVRGQTISEKPFNGIDDDLDGLIDENENVHKGLKYRDWINRLGFDNLMIDESRDDGIDNDKDWNPDIDDVGADGVAGTGDEGEGDGAPTAGEPNFDATDKDESDQIGLTAFDSFYIGQGVEFQYDEVVWERIANYHFDVGKQNGNISFLFGSGPFIMPPGHKERFSLALVFGENLSDLKRNKQVVQDIYNANYNFARPPLKPIVTVVPGDKKVTLYWDDLAESSYDEFAAPETGGYDFEGYKIYKATDAAFNDAYIITNGYGEATFHESVAQFDLKNDIKGFFDVDVHGVKYYLGDDTKLKHSWTDTDVHNGKTFYYAVVSYDRGWADKYILPSECTKVIFKNIYGDITLDKNTVMTVPNAPSSGYISPEIPDGIKHISGPGTGKVTVDILDQRLITDSEYIVSFDDTTHKDTIVYSLFEITSDLDTIPIFEESKALNNEDSNPVFNGLQVKVSNNPIAYNDSTTGWIAGSSNLDIYAELHSYWHDKKERRDGFPTNYEIRFGIPDSSFRYSSFKHSTNFQVWDIPGNKKVRYYLWEPQDNMDSLLTAGDHIELWLKVGSSWKRTWIIYFVAPEDEEPIQPDSGDVAFIGIDLPFRSGDAFYFKTVAAKVDKKLAISSLNKIAVVPNPYVAAASWEPPRLTASGRGERRLYFIHLPCNATIRIYTMSGSLVNTLHHHSSIDDGALSWNMLTKDG
ncbi:MAG: hypothetical protein KAX28_14470, partial [Candidatus Marinimicrobia bacterium]|nr:hypothetical protein [Candidatus Neomarinimicrobiota bacterium]